MSILLELLTIGWSTDDEAYYKRSIASSISAVMGSSIEIWSITYTKGEVLRCTHNSMCAVTRTLEI